MRVVLMLSFIVLVLSTGCVESPEHGEGNNHTTTTIVKQKLGNTLWNIRSDISRYEPENCGWTFCNLYLGKSEVSYGDPEAKKVVDLLSNLTVEPIERTDFDDGNCTLHFEMGYSYAVNFAYHVTIGIYQCEPGRFYVHKKESSSVGSDTSKSAFRVDLDEDALDELGIKPNETGRFKINVVYCDTLLPKDIRFNLEVVGTTISYSHRRLDNRVISAVSGNYSAHFLRGLEVTPVAFTVETGGYTEVDVCFNRSSETIELISVGGLDAKDMNNVETCRGIGDWSLKQNCYAEVAIKEGNWSLCEEIESDTVRDFCYVSVNAAKAHIQICDRITDERLASRCYRSIAIETKNSTLCNKLVDLDAILGCYKNIALQLPGIDACQAIEGKDFKGISYRNECFKRIGIMNNNTRYCDMVEGINKTLNQGYHRDHCYLGIATKLQDPQLCQYIENHNTSFHWTKSDCYFEIATKLKDARLCENIEREELKEDCYSQAGA